jgi:homogentisate 1,2-dioxygenase
MESSKMQQRGFSNYHQSEAIENALPAHQNSPQHPPFELYAEQINGSAFTAPRHSNLRTWFYRLLPSVVQQPFTQYSNVLTQHYPGHQSPNPLRWSPHQSNTAEVDFIDSLFHVSGNDVVACYLYNCNQSMTTRYFYDADGELLLVPQSGKLEIKTELGKLLITPGMIAVIPRGIKFQVILGDDHANGYVCELRTGVLSLPDLGPIGANGLANPRDFIYPNAEYEEKQGDFKLITKYSDTWWIADIDHSPLNVVAWHGNYAPYCYDLRLFNTMNTVSFDHPDPSIFTVLTSQSNTPGMANLDFVIFPERWMVAENTFRPPYYHRNLMSELMGLIYGEYDAKPDGFNPGGVSIHNCMTAHGPDKDAYDNAVSQELTPERYQNTLAFMFETCLPWKVTEKAMGHESLQKEYHQCWQSLEKVKI